PRPPAIIHIGIARIGLRRIGLHPVLLRRLCKRLRDVLLALNRARRRVWLWLIGFRGLRLGVNAGPLETGQLLSGVGRLVLRLGAEPSPRRTSLRRRGRRRV